TVMTVGTGLMILVGGVTVLLGWHRFIGAGLLVLFLVSTAFLMHPFWKEQDPTARMNEMAHFQKDLAPAGAALLLAYYAGWPWPFSLGG
ncbi:MAG: DoxX family protein, partial [Gemmatimonadota bacterium]|nr:DoxX family protein [Gemmatimonadota bacterium]